jgi:hypothetical protein
MTDNEIVSSNIDRINIATIIDVDFQIVPDKFDEEIFLSECWTLYFHDPDDNQWTPNSYKIINQNKYTTRLVLYRCIFYKFMA